MRLGVTISTTFHALLLGWGLVSFSARPFEAKSVEPMPVDIVSATEFSQITAGVKTAPKAETPKPLVEKVAEQAKPVKDDKPKISDKPEIQSAAAEPTPPKQEQPPKPEAKPQKPDEIAEALKKEPPKPKPPPKPPQPKLDLSKVENKLALLDKREQRRHASAGETLNTTANLGSDTGRSSILAAHYQNALVSKLVACWKADGGNVRDEVDSIYMTIAFNPDGTLAKPPQLDVPPRNAREQAIAMGVMRAVISCQPFEMLPRARYDEWKSLAFKFCPIPEQEGSCKS
jgi:colicin import membrane protein